MTQLFFALALILFAGDAVAADKLKPGYVVCESGGQLRWFIDLKDLNELWKPHKKALEVARSPGWRPSLRIAGAQGAQQRLV